MEPKQVVIGTAGHIDHGKTALIQALTGTDTDRLPEEKRRGITIDLGFASLRLGEYCIGFIDVPGHHAFIRNMLAGAGGIDAVMLVISAEEGVKPQTVEHVDICRLLGIRGGVVALTKCDAVLEGTLRDRQIEVQSYLKTTFLHGAQVTPVSARTGAGLSRLLDALQTLAGSVPERLPDMAMRFPLDRAFAIRGFGTVVTGTLQAGRVKRGETLALFGRSGLRDVRVRGLEVHGREVEEAVAGSRVAANLGGISLDQVHRGDTLTADGNNLTAVSAIDAQVSLLADAVDLARWSSLRSGLKFHWFTSDVPARMMPYGSEIGGASTEFAARLVLDSPLPLLPGDRFVLRRSSPAQTLGGGRVIDAHPLPGMKRKTRMEWLARMRFATRAEQVCLRGERRGVHGIELEQLERETGLTAAAISLELRPLLASGLLCQGGSVIFSKSGITAAERLIEDCIRQGGGLKRSALLSRLKLPEPVVELAIASLCAGNKLQVRGELVQPFGTASGLSEQDHGRMTAVQAAYHAAGLNAPLLRDVGLALRIEEKELRRLVPLLLREKKLLRMGADDLYMDAEVVEDLRRRMAALRGQTLDVARFKQMTGLSRRCAIPLLEYLDRERVTRRIGETRVVA